MLVGGLVLIIPRLGMAAGKSVAGVGVRRVWGYNVWTTHIPQGAARPSFLAFPSPPVARTQHNLRPVNVTGRYQLTSPSILVLCGSHRGQGGPGRAHVHTEGVGLPDTLQSLPTLYSYY